LLVHLYPPSSESENSPFTTSTHTPSRSNGRKKLGTPMKTLP
jgi:hypothetical protein